MDTENQLSRAEKRQIFWLGMLLLLTFGGCTYQLGYPYNCTQAESVVEEAESEFDDASREASKIFIHPEDAVEARKALYFKALSLTEARQKAFQKCLSKNR